MDLVHLYVAAVMPAQQQAGSKLSSSSGVGVHSVTGCPTSQRVCASSSGQLLHHAALSELRTSCEALCRADERRVHSRWHALACRDDVLFLQPS